MKDFQFFTIVGTLWLIFANTTEEGNTRTALTADIIAVGFFIIALVCYFV